MTEPTQSRSRFAEGCWKSSRDRSLKKTTGCSLTILTDRSSVLRSKVKRIMRQGICLGLLLVGISVPAWAVDPDKRLSQYAHTAWRVQDGFFKGSPRHIVQTRDGYLWLATMSELLRFDGVRFVPWRSERGERLPSDRFNDLLAARDGSLWISTDAGLSRWKDQTLSGYAEQPGGGLLLEDRNGTIWFDQGQSGSGSLCQVVESATRCHALGGADRGGGNPGHLIEDRQGNMWIGGSRSLVRWSHGSQTMYQPDGLKSAFDDGITGLAATPDGTIWVGFAKRGPGLGLQQLVDGRWKTVKTPELDGATLVVSDLHVDREGALWIGTDDQGIYRLFRNHVDHFDSTQGLSSDFVTAFLDDREGNLWVTTTQGVDRFSDTAVAAFSTTEGLCSTEVDSILAARDGGIWVGGDGALSKLHDGRVTCLRTGKGLPGSQVTSLLEDHAGRMWVGLDNMLWVNEDGHFRKITKPDGNPIGFVTGIAEDADHNVWVVANGPPRTLTRIQGMKVQEAYSGAMMPRRVEVDPTGGVWLGLLNGDLAHYRYGELTNYKFAHDQSALLYQLLPDRDGSVLAATSYGLIGWQNGKQLTLTEKNGLPCNGIDAMTFDDHGNLWLFMRCALGELTSADLQSWKHDPDHRVSLRTLDMLDGVRVGSAPFLAAARSPDGRLWFANGVTLQMTDPAHMRTNTVRPPVHIENIIADRRNYPATGVVRLPPLTRDLEIDYVGLSFVTPQRVLFRYRLEGRDQTWQEPGTRRQALYNDLRPGRYRFRAIASNNDGLWNEEGAAIDIVVAPAWYQTKAFLLLCVMTSIVAMWAAHRLRMRQVARALNARFDERLAERTRVARDLHDTLLQTVQGSKMVADDALSRPDDTSGMRHAMERVSTWLGQATTEGRAAVNALRASTNETNDLAEAFRRAIEDCRRKGLAEATLSVNGTPRELHPVVRDEIYRIGYEAIRNACTHSSATRLDVDLSYDRDLTVRVMDNGIGIDAAFVDEGKPGHFGLQGMRERATRIGATFTVVSSADSGTEITLVVPGHVIFRRQTASMLARVRAHFTS
jgi:signal transduction histidine kinase/ligand-binding sensor domain-containing protein